MDKRYQVFVSSTFADLKEERKQVIQSLMEMDCIPSGMELFPAADEEQFNFIKKVIDDCDYYILIIGGRYGSTTSDGISYTEKEFDYAISKGIKVLVFPHANPENIPASKTELDPTLRERLRVFRERAKESRLVKEWNTASELPGLVALSLAKTIKTYPAIGWMRADQLSNEQLLSEINELRKENEALNNLLISFKNKLQPEIENLATFNDKFTINGISARGSSWSVELTWREIFSIISPYLIEIPNEQKVQKILAAYAYKKLYTFGDSNSELKEEIIHIIRIQFEALKLIEVKRAQTMGGTSALFWYPTELGSSIMIQLKTIKK